MPHKRLVRFKKIETPLLGLVDTLGLIRGLSPNDNCCKNGKEEDSQGYIQKKKVDAKHAACLNAATMGVDVSVKVRANTMRKLPRLEPLGALHKRNRRGDNNKDLQKD